MKWVLYHCAITADQEVAYFFIIFYFPVQAIADVLKPRPLDDEVRILPLSYDCWPRHDDNFEFDIFVHYPHIKRQKTGQTNSLEVEQHFLWINTGNAYLRGRIGTIHLLIPTSLDQLFFTLIYYLPIFQNMLT
jgi:hypothetical protein